MSYINKSMSINAQKAYNKGLFTLSRLNSELLKTYNFKYSVSFFKWLCKNQIIKPSESHHTSAFYNLTKFYSPKCFFYANKYLNLEKLYGIYLSKEPIENFKKNIVVEYTKIKILPSLLGLKSGGLINLDCIKYQRRIFISENMAINIKNTGFQIISKSFIKPENWENPSEQKIKERLLIYSHLPWLNVI